MLQNSVVILSRLFTKMAEYPDRIWLGNGDTYQNTDFHSKNNVSIEWYLENVVPQFFPHKKTLLESRRMLYEKDRVLLAAIRTELIAGARPIDVVMKYAEHLNTVTQPSQLTGISKVISYNNTTSHIMNMYLGLPTDEVGMTVIYRGKTDKNKDLLVNEEYEVTAIEAHHYVINNKRVRKNQCRLPVAFTGKSQQGATLNVPYAIMDMNAFYADGRWFYTALSRCRELSKVYIYIGGAPEIDITSKIKGYKIQDKAAGRNSEYVLTEQDVKDIMKRHNFTCCRCSDRVELVYEAGSEKQWTLDRINNDREHCKSNLRLACLACNRAEGYKAKTSEDITFD